MNTINKPMTAEQAARAQGWAEGGGYIYQSKDWDSWKEAVSWSGEDGWPASPVYAGWTKCCEGEGIEFALHEYLFDVKLFAAIRVKARSEGEAIDMMMRHINANTANLGAWPNGDPITCEVSMDDGDSADLVEVDGEDV